MASLNDMVGLIILIIKWQGSEALLLTTEENGKSLRGISERYG
jgi:hypothetical protein